jgi:hypothetical protein
MGNLEIPEKLGKIVEWTKLNLCIEAGGDQRAYFYDREIWWASLGSNIGYEEDGKNRRFERPVLVLKRFNHNMLWALPMTSQARSSEYFYLFDFALASNIH